METTSGQNPPPPTTGVSRRMVFWATFVVVTIPFFGFFWQSVWLLQQNVGEINKPPPSAVVLLLRDTAELNDEKERLGFLSKAWVAMDHDRIRHRHQIMDWAYTARTSTRLMSLIFGAILITTGSVFVLSRVTGPKAEVDAQLDSLRLSFRSSSPGLILAFLGCVLIVVPNVAKQRITFGERPIQRQQEARPTSPNPPIQPAQDGLPDSDQLREWMQRFDSVQDGSN